MPNLKCWLYSLYDLDPTPVVDFLHWLVASYGLEGTLSVLDVGCGPGRLLKPLADLGWHVTGLEPDADYFAGARQFESENITVQQGGFIEIEATATCDLVIALNAPFAYLLTLDARIDALKRIHRALKPGGVVFIDVPNGLWLLRHYAEPKPSSVTAPDGQIVKRVVQHQFDFNTATFKHIDHFYVDNIPRQSQTHHLAIITPEDLRYTLRQTGFHGLRAYNHFLARESQRIAGSRLMVSAQKLPTAPERLGKKPL